MKVADKATPVAAVVAALSALACCMPLGLLGVAGLAGFGLWAAKYRPWFSAAAFLLLVAGFVQVYRGRGSCKTRSKATVITLWTAFAIVLLIFLFPQLIASLLAGWS